MNNTELVKGSHVQISQIKMLFKPVFTLFLLIGFAVSACGDDGGASVDGADKSGDHVLGDPDAPITFIEYASLTCGACGAFHAVVYPELKKDYIDTGKVRFIFREFPTPPADRAVAGFMLASCMPEDRYFSFLDVLFQAQRTWVTAQDAYSELKKIGQMGGLNSEQFDACLNNQDEFDRILKVQEYASETLGVNATPTFIINGQKYENRPYEQIKAILDPMLEEAGE